MNHFHRPSRNGNAIVLAIGVMALAATIIATTTNSMVVAVGDTRRQVDHEEVTAAVSTTLVRREKMLSQAATLGAEGFVRRFDPSYNYDLDAVGFVGSENYGVDYVGGVQVRWRIQPVTAREGGVWKQNPRADGEAQPLELPNTFLFRIEAEGRLPGTDGAPRARVQGVRYSAISKDPLFRYIIFYSQEGAKGDIEFAHGPAFAAKGSVHTNGSIYLGGAAISASWDALNSGLMTGATQLGPYVDPYTNVSSPALVNAYDGIFRLSKQVLYNRANGFQIGGTPPGSFNDSDWYATTGSYPGETGSVVHYRTPTGSTIAAATFNGTEINPNRVKDGRGLATSQTGDTQRTINNIPVRGIDEGTAKANDSRDRFRSGGLVWATDSLGPSPNGFDKRARSSDNGGRIVKLPTIMGNRAFEAQKVVYEDVDGDPTTDNHEYARPLFLTTTDGETTTHPAPTGPVVESPGSYMAFGLGSSDLALTRVMRGTTTTSQDITSGYNAWTVTSKNGAATSTVPETMGLIIRERMQPDLNYISGSPASSAGPDYVPYAYGKHLKVSRWPLWAIDVSAQQGSDTMAGMRNGNGYYRHTYTTTNASEGQIDSSKSKQNYSDGGLLSVEAAADESYGSWTDNISSYTRHPAYYRSNWRMFHMQRPQPDESQSGLVATATYDFDSTRSWLPSGGYLGSFGGQIVARKLWTTTINNTDFTALLGGTPAAGHDYFSVRWTGFIKPPVSGAYTFYLSTDDGGRLWVNDVRLADQWALQGTTTCGGGEKTTVTLEKDVWYPIVAEMFECSGGQEARLEWSTNGLAKELIPMSRCAPPKGTSGGAFSRSDWKAVQAKITPTTVAAAGKLGLMVRPLARAPAVPGTIVTIVREAENFTAKSNGTGTYAALSWSQINPDATASGGTCMQVPDGGVNASTVYTGPRMVYDISFPKAGTYYLWILAQGPSGSSDSFHVLFKESGGTEAVASNGSAVSRTPSAAMATSWRWVTSNSTGPVSINVPSAMTHQLIICMREDGTKLDKLLLTTATGTSTMVPAGAGGAPFSIDSAGVPTGTCPEGTYVDPGTPAAPSGLPTLASGMDPYLALAYSPTRGVFAEFRGAAAASDGRAPNRFFTGTSSETDANGEQAADVGAATRSALVTPSLVSSNVDTYTDVQNYTPNDKSGSSSAAGTTNGLTVSEGSYDNVRSGAWEKYRSQQPQIDLIRQISTTWRFTLGSTAFPATQIFITSGNPSDWGRTINFYTDPTLATTTTNPASIYLSNWSGSPVISNFGPTSFDATWTTSNDPGWTDWANTSGFTAGTTTYGSKTVGDTTFTNVQLTTTISGALVKKSWSFGDANTYWYIDSNPPKYSSTTTPVPFSNFKSNILALNPANKVVRITSGNSPPSPDAFTVPYLADPASGYLSAPAIPGAWGNGVTPRTISIDRTGTVLFDSNSYVTSRGSWWFGANQPLNVLPWTATTLWKNITVPPTTGSFRPDQWNYTWATVTDPANYPRRANITPTGNTTTTDAAQTQVGSPRWTSDLPAVWPPAGGVPAQVWLRIERSSADMLTMKYAFTASTPTAGDWQTVTTFNGVTATWPIDSWSPDLLIGPCLQSGSKSTAAAMDVSDMSVEFHSDQASPEMAAVDSDKKTLSYPDWEGLAVSTVTASARYLAGQYQVFFGPYEITEDFFTWTNSSGDMVASENWIYQLREFWSQSPWWNTYVSGTPTSAQEKDPGNLQPTTLTPTVRELIARTTLLNLDMGVLQSYLKTRLLTEAVADRISSAGPTSIPTPAANTLASRMNGLIYVSRANRYPWNPNMQGTNPWNVALPNSTALSTTSNSALLAMSTSARASQFSSMAASMANYNQTKLHSGTTSIKAHLQPYADLIGDQAPAFKPTQFHHGVRLLNGASIDWAFSSTGSPNFGTGKTAIITPNLLYVQGDFNSTKQNVTKNSVPNTLSYVPVALVGDQINFLSPAWNDADWKTPGLTADANGLTSACITAGSSLARGWQTSLPLPTAGYAPSKSAVEVVAALITHNQPTTRESVRVGEAASIISTMLFLENWGGKNFNYTGSLVVMDSRRCTTSFQLDSDKKFGPSALGYISPTWRTSLSLTDSATIWGAGTSNKIPAAYVAPSRSFTFNPDLLTPQGTPPFAPFGTSARGVGGWIKVFR